MKKVITILFLGIYVFSLAGYQCVFVFFERTISEKIIVQLDKGDYDDAALVEIKIPYPMLYAYNSNEYKRYDGEVEMNGIHYNYVKRKLSNDTLYLLCIPNHDQTSLAAAKIDYLKKSCDAINPQDGKKSSSGAAHKPFAWEGYDLMADIHMQVSTILLNRLHPISQTKLPSAFIAAAFQPPKMQL